MNKDERQEQIEELARKMYKKPETLKGLLDGLSCYVCGYRFAVDTPMPVIEYLGSNPKGIRVAPVCPICTYPLHYDEPDNFNEKEDDRIRRWLNREYRTEYLVWWIEGARD